MTHTCERAAPSDDRWGCGLSSEKVDTCELMYRSAQPCSTGNPRGVTAGSANATVQGSCAQVDAWGHWHKGDFLLSRDRLRRRGEIQLSDHCTRSSTGLSFNCAQLVGKGYVHQHNDTGAPLEA